MYLSIPSRDILSPKSKYCNGFDVWPHNDWTRCPDVTGVVHSWKSWIISLTEVIFPEYQCDFRYRASPNILIHCTYSRYISLLDVPDLKKSTRCQADNTRSEPLLDVMELVCMASGKPAWNGRKQGQKINIGQEWAKMTNSAPIPLKSLMVYLRDIQITKAVSYILVYCFIVTRRKCCPSIPHWVPRFPAAAGTRGLQKVTLPAEWNLKA